jgi:hypothetical protein
MPNIDNEIRSMIESFATDLAGLVRRAALESVQTVLGGGATVAAPVEVAAAKRGPGRPKRVATPAAAAPTKPPAAPVKTPAAKSTKAAPAAKAPVSKKPAAAKRPLGQKRPPGELAKLTERLGDYIKAHPGLRMEVIGKALGAPTKDLNLPVKKLLAAKKIRTEGEKRATEYFAA